MLLMKEKKNSKTNKYTTPNKNTKRNKYTTPNKYTKPKKENKLHYRVAALDSVCHLIFWLDFLSQKVINLDIQLLVYYVFMFLNSFLKMRM